MTRLLPTQPERIRAIMQGTTSTLSRREAVLDMISPREIHVWRATAAGMRGKEVAAELGISIKTVGAHRASLYLKLGAHSAADLTRLAVRFGVITVEVLPP